MPSSDAQPGYKPSQEAVRILCERLQRMGVSMSEPSARSLLESVLAVEGARLDALARGTLEASLEAIRNAAEAALIALTGRTQDEPNDDSALFDAYLVKPCLPDELAKVLSRAIAERGGPR